MNVDQKIDQNDRCQVLNWQWESVGEVELSPFIFQQGVRKDILTRVVLWQLAKRRSGNHKTKGISDISGTTRKPYRQKGTGNARHGSRRSPQFVGGAVIFGPVVRSHEHSLNKKVKSFGLRVALSLKRQQGNLFFLEDISVPSCLKTRDCRVFFEKTGAKSALLVSSDSTYGNIERGILNLPAYNVLHQDGLNVYDILRHEHLIISRSSLQYIEGRLQ
ncbi:MULTISPECIES: 50S ribosomal protein L4 [Holospora]|uniref:Large ribosomal subunit protein uL4 n=2 Tax=Holospora TaxID=44747 RepID=A0A061JIC0_9PROT|nr:MULTISPECIES: 50S ribosomal protein L4 [Holospora]ETZ04754.1 50S ribosomal protein L4 [Holospora undulata HU1]GAJ46018.1 50S ribosomal protein L4 [Holospora elegans E1]